MKSFVFSADSHIREPNTLYSEKLPARMRDRAIRAEHADGLISVRSGEKVFHKLRLRGMGEGGDLAQSKRKGASNLVGRVEDMVLDGIDAEICFPELALWTYCIDDPELEFATTQIYNDWNNAFLSNHLNRFVRCGVLPVRDHANTVFELKRLAGLGYTAAMLPVVTAKGVKPYNDESWDTIFNLAGELGIVIVMHTGTGLDNVVVERGPGGAVVNYTRQMSDAINTVLILTAGGVLDRNPQTHVAIIEAGASWLSALSERMDEVYRAHAHYVKPKLSVPPSEIVRRQVHASFQHDRACVLARAITGTQALLFASDYPHAEGTFPNTRAVVSKLFEGVDISDQDRTDILGGNAVRLFRLPPTAEVAESLTG
jgi:predicted TIM-barrel fold metal-dependent hydrolase